MGDEWAKEVPGKWKTSFRPFAHEVQGAASPDKTQTKHIQYNMSGEGREGQRKFSPVIMAWTDKSVCTKDDGTD